MAKKKVVRVESTESTADAQQSGPTWKPTAEAKSKSTQFRLIAAALWAVAIGLEAWAIFGVLNADEIKMWLLILLIVVIGLFAVGGSLLWKQANRLDPASKNDTVRFFVQNQLGAIITVIAFLPLIVLILLNKDMTTQQKALAGGLGAIVMVAAAAVGIDWNAPSTEQYTAETNEVTNIKGQDLVYWTKSGKVFHLCEKVSAVNKTSKDNKIYEGTVADAHAAGKDRLTKQVALEAKQCGFALPTATPNPVPTASAN